MNALHNQSCTRRDFLAAAVTAAVVARPVGLLADEPIDTIIDTHTHFYDPTRPQGVPFPGKDDKLLYRPVLPPEFQALTKPLQVTGTVIVEASPWVEDNQWVLDLADRNPFIVGLVGNLSPGTADFVKHLTRFSKNRRFRGIRIGHSALQAGLSEQAFLADIQRLVELTTSTYGPIDLFCSNAGILGGFGALELNDDQWRDVLDVNLMAHIRVARHLVPRMLERGGGYLLQTASAAGLLTQIGLAPYSVTKHAAIAFAEWLSITYGERGLRVSVLCPQAVRTGMTAGTTSGGVAGVDGMLEPDAVADVVVDGLDAEKFLILPHPEVAEYFQRKANDYDRWIAGMQRLQARFPGGM